jgi:hypothetical protein
MNWTCPVCGMPAELRDSSARFISCVVRCKKCDSSIGLSLMTGGVSVVYTRVPQEKWVIKPVIKEEEIDVEEES